MFFFKDCQWSPSSSLSVRILSALKKVGPAEHWPVSCGSGDISIDGIESPSAMTLDFSRFQKIKIIHDSNAENYSNHESLQLEKRRA